MCVNPEVATMRLAAGQLGLFTSTQAIDRGWRARAVNRRVAAGEVRQAQPGVFAFTAAPVTWEQRLLAALLAGGAQSGVSHESAVVLHGCEDWIDGFTPRVELSVTPGTQPRLRRVALHRLQLPPEHLTMVRGFRCTTFARTVVDLSGRTSLGQLARTLDDGLIRNRTTLRELARVAAVLPPAPGRRPGRISLLLAERVGENESAESHPEIRLVNALVDAGLPAPVPQFRVAAGEHRFRLDAAYPELRLGLEYLGFDTHRSRTAFEGDFRRDRMLSKLGWTILYFTRACSDSEIAADVRQFLEPRAA